MLAVLNVKVEVKDPDLGHVFKIKPNSLLNVEYLIFVIFPSIQSVFHSDQSLHWMFFFVIKEQYNLFLNELILKFMRLLLKLPVMSPALVKIALW